VASRLVPKSSVRVGTFSCDPQDTVTVTDSRNDGVDDPNSLVPPLLHSTLLYRRCQRGAGRCYQVQSDGSVLVGRVPSHLRRVVKAEAREVTWLR
jgi:hypothetical protein